MNVLLLTQVLPYPPDSGPKVKTWNVLKSLSREHEVTLVSFVRDDQSDAVRHLEKHCEVVHTVPMDRGVFRDIWAMFISLLTGKPFLMVRDDRRRMRRLIDRVARNQSFDVVHADQLNMAQFALRLPEAKKVLDAHNALWLLYKRLWQTMRPGARKFLLGRDWRLLKSYEGRTCQAFEIILSVSEEDRQALEEAIGERLDIKVIPIAVDTDEIKIVPRHWDAHHVLHVGTMYWPPNIDGALWFLDEVWPRIQRERPEVKFDLVGTKPPAEILSFTKNGNGVNVTGYVADPEPFIQRAAVMVVPLRAGGGMRVKILNALAQGLPTVSTTLGCEGIEVNSGEHLLIADTPRDFAEATLRLLGDRQLADTLGSNGRRLIEARYDYRNVHKRLKAIYQYELMGEIEDG